MEQQTGMDYADQLFLLQQKSWIMKIRKYGMIYAILFHDVVIRLLASVVIFYVCILIKYKKLHRLNALMIGLYKRMLS
jgi:hypothetical protein